MQRAFCRPPNGGRVGRLAVGDGAARRDASHAWTRVRLVRTLRPLLQKGDILRAGSGQPKASPSGQGEAFASGQKPPSSTRRKNANADRRVTLHAKFISSHGWLAQGK